MFQYHPIIGCTKINTFLFGAFIHTTMKRLVKIVNIFLTVIIMNIFPINFYPRKQQKMLLLWFFNNKYIKIIALSPKK